MVLIPAIDILFGRKFNPLSDKKTLNAAVMTQ